MDLNTSTIVMECFVVPFRLGSKCSNSFFSCASTTFTHQELPIITEKFPTVALSTWGEWIRTAVWLYWGLLCLPFCPPPPFRSIRSSLVPRLPVVVKNYRFHFKHVCSSIMHKGGMDSGGCLIVMESFVAPFLSCCWPDPFFCRASTTRQELPIIIDELLQ
jgi:hypothetical protein